LAKHAGTPAIDSVIATLTKLAAASPQRVYELRYTQTPASVTAMVKEAKSRTTQLDRATTQAPRALFGLGALLLLAGAIAFFIGRKRHPAAPVVTPAEPVTPEIPIQQAA